MTDSVFISYSHDSRQHGERILALADRLRQDGINCILDQYEPHPAEGWPRWMERQIDKARFVLMICTKTYYQRVMGMEKKGTGKGVKWEGNLIYNRIYGNDTRNDRFIAVLPAPEDEKHIPNPLQGQTFIVRPIRTVMNSSTAASAVSRWWSSRPWVKPATCLQKTRRLDSRPLPKTRPASGRPPKKSPSPDCPAPIGTCSGGSANWSG